MKVENWPLPAEENPFHIMAQMKGRMFQLIQNRFEEFDLELGMEGFVILTHIRQENGLHQTQLAEIIGRDKPSVTRALDSLEERGWVLRQVDPEDRRSHRLALTEEGERVVNLAAPFVREIIARIFDPVSDVDYRTFLSVLRDLHRQLDTLEA